MAKHVAEFRGASSGSARRRGRPPAPVIAGAGTGKTTTNTLGYRVAHLVIEGVALERILRLTSARRAALEIRRRAGRIVAEAHRPLYWHDFP